MKRSVLQKAIEFDENNPHIYKLFRKYAVQAYNAGFDKFSATAIFEKIRWDLTVETTDSSGFKLANNHKAYYARKLMKREPDWAEGFFDIVGDPEIRLDK